MKKLVVTNVQDIETTENEYPNDIIDEIPNTMTPDWEEFCGIYKENEATIIEQSEYHCVYELNGKRYTVEVQED